MKWPIIGILCLLALNSFSQEKVLIDKVIAKVGGETILLSDIEGQYSYLKQQSPDVDPNAKCQILDAIIGQKLIVHQAKLDSIVVGPEEIDAQLDFRVNAVLRQMGGDENFFQEYYGMTVPEMRENLRDDLESQVLAERMQQSLIADINITPSEVEDFYELIPKDSLPYLSAEVEFAELVQKPEPNEIEKEKTSNKINEIRAQIVSGEITFAEAATKFSDDPGSAARGGDLGFAERGTFVPEFEEAAYNLDQDEISDAVETEYGFHIIKLNERRGTKLKLQHILIRPTITDDDIEKCQNSLDSIRTLIVENELDFGKAVKEYSLEEVQSYHNNGRVQNPSTGKTFFETGNLPTDVYFAIEDMNIGDVSGVISYATPQGESYYRIIQLQSKTKPHKANLSEDYAKIKELARESKKNEYFTKWLDDKLKETYIDIDPILQHCNQAGKTDDMD